MPLAAKEMPLLGEIYRCWAKLIARIRAFLLGASTRCASRR